jgi:hypothetical protein
MNNSILYKEKSPKFVFKGSAYNIESIKLIHSIIRITAFMIFVGSLVILALPPSENRYDDYIGAILMWIGSFCLIAFYEPTLRRELDGNIPVIIDDKQISIPPRVIRKLFGQPDHLNIDQIDRVLVIRGYGGQYIGKKEGVLWEDSPIGMKIIIKTGKKISLGFKPPSTIKEICNVLSAQWNVRIEDPGSGMGVGTRYSKDRVLWKLPYEDIMKMNLFEWQD